jgi:hypothetical protein
MKTLKEDDEVSQANGGQGDLGVAPNTPIGVVDAGDEDSILIKTYKKYKKKKEINKEKYK